MQRIVRIFAVASIVVAVGAGAAHAQFNSPFKGKAFKANLMTAYQPCTVPNAMTDDGLDACTPPDSINDACQFGGGQGKVQLKHVTVGKVAFRVKLTGLGGGCEGANLSIVATLRRSGKYCQGSFCTMADLVDTPIGACVVSNGACSSNGQIILPGGTLLGQTEIKDVAVIHAGTHAFDAGIVQNQ